jgi:glycosyltransferase involved in cell wall biosynthesis
MTDRPLTVLQVLPALDGGGVERGVLEIADALVKAGRRSLVVSAGGRMVDELTQNGSQHYVCPIGAKSPLTLRWVPWLRRLMVDQAVDVVDIHSRLPGWMTWLAWKSMPRSTRPRLISTVHGLHSVNRYSRIMCSGEAVIVVSETLLNYVLHNYPGVAVNRLRLIHRGIDSSEYPRGFQPSFEWRQEFHSRFPGTRGQKLITLPGRITRLKGHHDFLQMMADVVQSEPSAHGLIVGGTHPRKTSYANEIRDRIETLGLQQHITLTGQRSDLKQLYAASHVVVSLSQTPESFGRTVGEALSIGTPVVGYNHGGVAEILAAQFPFGAVVPRDVAGLAQRTLSLLQQQDHPVPGANRFAKSDMLQRTLDVYADVSETPRSRKAA